MAERPEDLNLPTPVVAKLINDCLPSTCKVTDEAKVAITKVQSIILTIFLDREISGCQCVCPVRHLPGQHSGHKSEQKDNFWKRCDICHGGDGV